MFGVPVVSFHKCIPYCGGWLCGSSSGKPSCYMTEIRRSRLQNVSNLVLHACKLAAKNAKMEPLHFLPPSTAWQGWQHWRYIFFPVKWQPLSSDMKMFWYQKTLWNDVHVAFMSSKMIRIHSLNPYFTKIPYNDLIECRYWTPFMRLSHLKVVWILRKPTNSLQIEQVYGT